MARLTVKMSDWPMEKAKTAVVGHIAQGKTVSRAMAEVGRTVKTYEHWRAEDDDFRARIDEARERRSVAKINGVSEEGTNALDIDFATWRKRYLGYETYPHMQQWIDVLEGREPIPIPGCEYVPGNSNRVLINTPPGHAKSQTITVDYVTYRICMDPNVRIVIMSKRVEQARKYLDQIKMRLTSPMYAELQAAYAPEGGFRPVRGEGQYAANVITVAGRTKDLKDPTVEALGLKTQIYGTRSDLIILDDIVTFDNVNDYEWQFDKVTGEIQSRIKNGKLLVVGTRVKPVDMYAWLLRDESYTNGKHPWTYLRQPMVLDFSEDVKDWRTLWPISTTPYDAEDVPGEDGLYAVFDGPACNAIRGSVKASTWSLVYQQMSVSEDAVFKAEAVYGSMNRGRAPGPLKAGAMHHPPGGGDGMFTIGSMDPAMSEDTFVVVGKVDRVRKERWIENAFIKHAPTPEWIRDIIKETTVKYGVNEWVIESNAFQQFLVQDTELVRWLANMGVKIVPHHTSRNKADPDFGVASMEMLFGGLHRTNDGAGHLIHDKKNLIHLPDANRSAGIDALCQQLVSWEPGVKGSKLKQDGPMALWFWELRARIFLGVASEVDKPTQQYVADRYMMDGERAQQHMRPVGFFGTSMNGW